MADLMSGSYTYEALTGKYSNFVTPLIKLKINGTDVVATMKLAVSYLKATLSLDAASMVIIKIAGLYDDEKHSFDSSAKGKFAIGTVVEVELGYLSSSLNIFKGFVAMLGTEFGEKTPLLVVTLMDARRLMMLTGSQYKLHDVKNYSDAFKTIIGKYSKLCSPEIEATSDNLESPISQTQDDYHFVTKELIQNGKADREFFILGDKAYFRTPRKVKGPIITLQYGRELLALKTDEAYRDLKIEVIGCDEDTQTVITGKATVNKASGQKSLITEKPEFFLTDSSITTQKRATDKAQMIADREEWKAQTGQGVTVGIPEIVPGRYIKVDKLDSSLCDHKYYLKTVIHEINGEEYRTMFQIEGWE